MTPRLHEDKDGCREEDYPYHHEAGRFGNGRATVVSVAPGITFPISAKKNARAVRG